MDKKTLLYVSLFADTLDFFLIGQAPGISLLWDLPVLLMHVSFGGVAAWICLLELIPVAGFLPVFSLMMWSYQNPEEGGEA